MRQRHLWALLGLFVAIAILGGLVSVLLQIRHMPTLGMQIPAQGHTVYRLDAPYRLLVPLPLYPKSRLLGFRPAPTGNADEMALLVVLATPDDTERVKQYYLQQWRRYGVEERRSPLAAEIGAPGYLLLTQSLEGSWASIDILRVARETGRPRDRLWSTMPKTPQGNNAETQIIFQVPIVAVKRR